MDQATYTREMRRLAGLLHKYGGAWARACRNYGEPSARMDGWARTYNAMKYDHPEQWAIYCKTVNACPSHDAGDCLA